PRTRPSILNYDNKTYVSYGQGHALDTLITRVHVKDNNGWSIDFEDVNLTTYSGGGIDGLYVRLGESSEGISLLTSLHTEGGHPLYLKNDGQSWQQETVNFNGSLTSQGWPAPNLQYDSENTVYWLNQDNSSNNLSWVKENGEGGLYKFPWFHSNKYLFDFVIKDNTVYIYYWEGSASWPYGTPVTFNELKINLAAFTSSIVESEFKVGAILQQNYPNPFSYNTIIKFSLSNSSLVDLSVYNVKGEKIITLVNELRTGGDYTESFNVNQLSKGTYFYILTLNENSLTKKMFVIK
ncbi:MAG: T9SS type A sorting domain-containing protein, partial [Saprospiraceae bacterium]|nr:T9SS type A sorting domain-containing protein [Saprospiraceae bacterium]